MASRTGAARGLTRAALHGEAEQVTVSLRLERHAQCPHLLQCALRARRVAAPAVRTQREGLRKPVGRRELTGVGGGGTLPEELGEHFGAAHLARWRGRVGVGGGVRMTGLGLVRVGVALLG